MMSSLTLKDMVGTSSMNNNDSYHTATRSSGDSSLKVVIPGERLFPTTGDALRSGAGTYDLHGHIYASLMGYVHLVETKDEVNINSHRTHVSVQKSATSTRTVEVRRHRDKNQHIVPAIGAIVTARVLNIGPRFAKCSILCVENSILPHHFNATLRREDIRATERDKIELHNCVRPGDILLARVVNRGDTNTSFILSTAEDQLGVVSSIGGNGERMIPASWTSVRAINDATISEPRKVAQIRFIHRVYMPKRSDRVRVYNTIKVPLVPLANGPSSVMNNRVPQSLSPYSQPHSAFEPSSRPPQRLLSWARNPPPPFESAGFDYSTYSSADFTQYRRPLLHSTSWTPPSTSTFQYSNDDEQSLMLRQQQQQIMQQMMSPPVTTVTNEGCAFVSPPFVTFSMFPPAIGILQRLSPPIAVPLPPPPPPPASIPVLSRSFEVSTSALNADRESMESTEWSCSLPPDCTRPQTREGRTFPLKLRTEFDDYLDWDVDEMDSASDVQIPSLLSKNSHQERRYINNTVDYRREEGVILKTATKIVRKAPATISAKSLRLPPTASGTSSPSVNDEQMPSISSNTAVSTTTTTTVTVNKQSLLKAMPPASVQQNSSNRIRRTSKTLINSPNKLTNLFHMSSGDGRRPRRTSEKKVQLSITVPRKSTERRVDGKLISGMAVRRIAHRSTAGTTDGERTATWSDRPMSTSSMPIHQSLSMKKNRSLRIINGQRIAADSDVCFAFSKDGNCPAGVFCRYSHAGNHNHKTDPICARLLRGKCRDGDQCSAFHSLQPHQMPVCEFYLRICCIAEPCSFLHVKHADFLQPCAAFVRGICHDGIMCNHPHRYPSAILQERGSEMHKPRDLNPPEAGTGSTRFWQKPDNGAVTVGRGTIGPKGGPALELPTFLRLQPTGMMRESQYRLVNAPVSTSTIEKH